MRGEQHTRRGPERVVGGQWLLLEDVEAGAGDLAGPQRLDQVVEPGRQAAPDIDEERGLLHLLKQRPVHEPFGFGSVRHRQDYEIRLGQQRIQLVAAVQFGDTRRRIPAALVDADHPHPECGSEARHFAADAANADDQRGRLGQMHDSRIVRQFLPFAFQLLRNVMMQPTGEGQHERHHMRADMVIVDLAEIGDGHRMCDQLGVVVAGRGRGLRCLQPAQPARPGQEVGRDYAKGGVGMGDHLGRMRVVFGDYDFELGQCRSEAPAPLARLFGLRRQHHEFGRHGEILPVGTDRWAKLVF